MFNLNNRQGRVNAAEQGWIDGRYYYTPVRGTMLQLDGGALWQITGTSELFDDATYRPVAGATAYVAEGTRTEATWDGVFVEVTGRRPQNRTPLAYAIRVRVHFYEFEEGTDRVALGWMKL